MRLAVTQLSLSHFRSHRRTALDFDGRPVAVFGPNGAGKTNLIEAISLLSPGRGLRRATASDLARRPEAIGWRVRAKLDSLGQTTGIELRAAPDQPRSLRIDDAPAPQIALARIARILWLTPAMDRLWLEAAEGRRRFLDRMTLSFTPDHGAAVLAYEKAMRDRNRLLRDGIRDPRWFSALEARMAQSGTAIIAARAAALDRLTAAQTGARTRAQTAFPTATLSLALPDDAGFAATEDALREALAAGRGADYRAGRTLTGPHRADLTAVYAAKAMPAAQCSTGEQKALLIALILANSRALAEDFGAPPILLLDEVAAHLDEARRAALYDEICALGAQAFLTGTEAGLFDALGDRAQRIEVIETDGLSRVVPGPG